MFSQVIQMLLEFNNHWLNAGTYHQSRGGNSIYLGEIYVLYIMVTLEFQMFTKSLKEERIFSANLIYQFSDYSTENSEESLWRPKNLC